MTRRRPEPAERLVVGLHPVLQLLRSGQVLRRLQIASSRSQSPVLDEILERAAAAGIPTERVDRDVLDRLADGAVHQGVIALAPPFPYAHLDSLLARATGATEPAFLVALDGVTDPHNLGSVARTAEAVGAHGLIVPSRRAAGVTPAAEKAAAGALAHLPVVRATNLVRELELCRRHGLWVVGLDADGPEGLFDTELLTEPLVLVVGSEGRGLARLTRRACDQLVRLPMRGAVGSLNASVAAAVAMYEVRRRRGA